MQHPKGISTVHYEGRERGIRFGLHIGDVWVCLALPVNGPAHFHFLPSCGQCCKTVNSFKL